MFKPNPRAQREVEKKLQRALENASEVLLEKVKSNAPKNTGKLRNSFELRKGKLEVKIGTDVEYADDVEFGTSKMPAKPYFRPAIKQSRKKMLNKFRNIL